MVIILQLRQYTNVSTSGEPGLRARLGNVTTALSANALMGGPIVPYYPLVYKQVNQFSVKLATMGDRIEL